jgi:hypothetical protein
MVYMFGSVFRFRVAIQRLGGVYALDILEELRLSHSFLIVLATLPFGYPLCVIFLPKVLIYPALLISHCQAAAKHSGSLYTDDRDSINPTREK